MFPQEQSRHAVCDSLLGRCASRWFPLAPQVKLEPKTEILRKNSPQHDVFWVPGPFGGGVTKSLLVFDRKNVLLRLRPVSFSWDEYYQPSTAPL